MPEQPEVTATKPYLDATALRQRGAPVSVGGECVAHEALLQARLHPETGFDELSGEELRRLFRAVRRVCCAPYRRS